MSELSLPCANSVLKPGPESFDNMSEKISVSDETYGKEKMKCSPIQEFYKNQTIFVTGGTGFIGKVLLEKLLRSCSGISRIYVLIRKKKGKDVHERIQNLLEDTVFDNVRSSVPNFGEKIIGIAGNCSLENLGLSNDDAALLKKDISIIFHNAATLRFEGKLKNSAASNLRSTVAILDMCKEMKNLKAFVYVSTGYAHNTLSSTIEEKFYDYPINYKQLLLLIDSLPDETIEAISPTLLKPWMNVYTCTKGLSENFLRMESDNLPVAIFRPLIVLASAYEPMPGWVDNYNGPTGIMAGVASGVVRTIHCDSEKRANLVPLDFTVNAMIACAWDLAMQTTRRDENMLIYNYTSTKDVPITWSKVRELSLKYNDKYPLKSAISYAVFWMTKYKFMYKLYSFFLHWVPAFLVDLAARIVGRKPQLMKIYEQVDNIADITGYAITREWDVDSNNVESLWNKLEPSDQSLFHFTMKGFDWDNYFSTYTKGIRMYLFKDDLKTLDASRIKYKRLFWINQGITVALLAAVAYFIYYTLGKIF